MKHLLLFVLTFFSLTAVAQTFSLSGNVIDRDSKMPLTAVRVELEGTTYRALAGLDGLLFLKEFHQEITN